MASISASPVTIIAPATTGQTTITWDNGGAAAIVSVQLDNNPPQSLGNFSSGSQYTVDCGHTYKFTLLDVRTNSVLAGPAVLTPDCPSSGPGGVGKGSFQKALQAAVQELAAHGGIQVIDQVKVRAKVTSVEVSFRLSVPTIPIVEIYKSYWQVASVDIVPQDKVAQGFGLPIGAYSNFFRMSFNDLEQDTGYWVKITAGGGAFDPPPSVSLSRFRTGNRRARVWIDQIYVYNAGDGGVEFSVQCFDLVRGTWVSDANFWLPPVTDRDTDDGTAINSPFGTPAQTAEVAPDNFGLYIQGDNWNKGVFGTLPLQQLDNVDPDQLPITGHGEGEHGPYGDDITYANVMTPFQLPEYSTFLDFNIDSGDWGIRYSVHGQVEVDVDGISFYHSLLEDVRALGVQLVKHKGKIGHAHHKSTMHSVVWGPDGKIQRRIFTRTFPRLPKLEPTWEDIGGPIFPEGFTFLSSPRGRIDVVGRIDNNRVVHSTWKTDGDDQTPTWTDLGGQVFSDVTAVRSSEDELNLFGLGKNGSVQYAQVGGNKKAGKVAWQSLGGKFVGTVAACSTKKEGLHLVALNSKGEAFHRTIDSRGRAERSQKWTSLGGQFVSAVITTTDEGVAVFGIDRNRVLFAKTLKRNKWAPGGSKWTTIGGIDGLAVPQLVKQKAKRNNREQSPVRRPARRAVSSARAQVNGRSHGRAG